MIPKEKITHNMQLLNVLFKTYFQADKIDRPVFDLELLQNKV